MIESVEQWRTGAFTSVAAHVHADTIPAAISPGLTLRDALLNSSELEGLKAVYRPWIAVKPTANTKVVNRNE